MTTLKRIPAAAAAALVLLSGCGDAVGLGRLDRGEFDGDVFGEFSFRMNGVALSGNSAGFGQDQILLADNALDVAVFALHLDDEFVEGRERLADLDDFTGVEAGIVIGDRAFVAFDGFIDIRDVSSSGIRGSLDFDAVEVDPITRDVLFDQVTVRVDFNTRFSSTCCGLFSRSAPTVRLRELTPK